MLRTRSLALVVPLVLALCACGSPTEVTAGSPSPPQTIGAAKQDVGLEPEPLAVGDSDSQIRGSVTSEEQGSRNDRVRQRLIDEGFISKTEPDRPDKAEIITALLAIEAVPVRDADGNLVGYLTDQFVPLDEYANVRAKAEQFIAAARERRWGSSS